MQKNWHFLDPTIKYEFMVMPFGPVNAPPFYTCAMGSFKTEWDLLFVELMTRYAMTNNLLGGQKVTISQDIFYLKGVKAISGTKSIINDILIWSNNLEAVLLHFQCVCRVFQKMDLINALIYCRIDAIDRYMKQICYIN